MTICNFDMAMTDDNRHSAAAEAEVRAIEERVTQTTIRLSLIFCAGMSSYFRFPSFASNLDRVFFSTSSCWLTIALSFRVVPRLLKKACYFYRHCLASFMRTVYVRSTSNTLHSDRKCVWQPARVWTYWHAMFVGWMGTCEAMRDCIHSFSSNRRVGSYPFRQVGVIAEVAQWLTNYYPLERRGFESRRWNGETALECVQIEKSEVSKKRSKACSVRDDHCRCTSIPFHGGLWWIFLSYWFVLLKKGFWLLSLR